MNCNSFCKKFTYFCVFSIIFIYTMEYNMPTIFDLLWPVTVSDSTSLRAIHNLQIDLYNLELELSEMLSYETHPLQIQFQEKLEPKLSAIETKSRYIDNYIQNYGPIKMEEIEKLMESCAETRQLLNQFSENFDQIKKERLGHLLVYDEKVTELAGFWTRWTMFKHLDYLDDQYFSLDREHQVDSEILGDLNSLLESIELVGKLLDEFENSDKMVTQIMNVGVKNFPDFSVNDQSMTLATLNGTEYYEISIPMLKKILRANATLIYRQNLAKFGEVYDEIVMATARVQQLLEEVIEYEKNEWIEMNTQLKEKMTIITKLHEDAPNKFNLNIQLRMAHNLDDEDPKDEL